LLGDLNAKVGREDIFKPRTVNESLHETSRNTRFTFYIFHSQLAMRKAQREETPHPSLSNTEILLLRLLLSEERTFSVYH
jgi:hypothetical protein